VSPEGPPFRVLTPKSGNPHRGLNRRSQKRSEARRKIYGELAAIAADQGHPVELGITTSDALQGCLDRAVQHFRYCASRADELDEDELFVSEVGPGGSLLTVPNKWLRLETEMRKEVEHLASMMTSLGIAERRVRVEEAQAILVAQKVQEAALEAGIPHEQVRAMGASLREKLSKSYTDVPPKPGSRYERSQARRTNLLASAPPSPSSSS
jgi:hypothetical protein